VTKLDVDFRRRESQPLPLIHRSERREETAPGPPRGNREKEREREDQANRERAPAGSAYDLKRETRLRDSAGCRGERTADTSLRIAYEFLTASRDVRSTSSTPMEAPPRTVTCASWETTR